MIGYPSRDPRGRALQRELIAREVESGSEWLVRMGGDERVHVRASVALLREHAPDLVRTSSMKIIAEIQRYLASEREKTAQLVREEVARLVD